MLRTHPYVINDGLRRENSPDVSGRYQLLKNCAATRRPCGMAPADSNREPDMNSNCRAHPPWTIHAAASHRHVLPRVSQLAGGRIRHLLPLLRRINCGQRAFKCAAAQHKANHSSQLRKKPASKSENVMKSRHLKSRYADTYLKPVRFTRRLCFALINSGGVESPAPPLAFPLTRMIAPCPRNGGDDCEDGN